MSTSRLDRLAALVVVLTLGMLLAGGTGTDAAFVVPTGNSGNAFSTVPDWKGPIISRAAVVKAEGGIPGYVRPGGSYTVIAAVADDPSSNPAAGLGAVRGDVSTITVGQTAAAMPVSASTFMGLTYTHRSAALTVPAGRAAQPYAGTLNASDLATPANASSLPISTVVDNTVPTPTSAVIANGGVAGRIDQGDTITYTWSEIIDPQSVLAGWTGNATSVTVEVVNQQGQVGDNITIRNAADTADLPLGAIEMRIRDYVTASTDFGGPTNGVRSQMAWDPAAGTITVTLGPPDANTTTVGTQTSNYIWRPLPVFDRAGNPSTTTAYTESSPPVDRDW
jgi:hypothetical protein